MGIEKHDIKPFDDTNINMSRELRILTHFKKEKGGMLTMNTELLQKNNQPIPAGTIGYMIIAALHIWANNVKNNNADEQTLKQAEKMMPHIKDILKIVQFINPDMALENLISQLGRNEGNTTN